MKTLQKTSEKAGTNPKWDETCCVSLLPRDDNRICFDIRDGEQLLNFGCMDTAEIQFDKAVMVQIDYAVVQFTIAPAPPPSPPAPPEPPPEPPSPPGACDDPWCDEFQSWVDDHDSKFHKMWGAAWKFKEPWEAGCWDFGLGGRDWLNKAFEGTWCDRNWMSGSAAAINAEGRPAFSAPAPALLGFDETILGYCSHQIGLDFDGGDLNYELADRCVKANKNVLRLMSGDRPWDMCQNIEWQFCALRGKLPGQDGRKVSFASAPKDVQVEWWKDPDTHPTYKPNWDGYALGDVFFAELCVTFMLCKNRKTLFSLEVGETMECDINTEGFEHLVDMFMKTT